MKRRNFLVCLFYCFFRLPIYESIAAIFWQSASYVVLFCTGNEGACSNYIPEEGTEENPVVKANESAETNGQINVNKVDSASEWAVNVLYSAIRVAVHSSDSVTFKMALFLALSTICRSCREIRKKLRQKILPPR